MTKSMKITDCSSFRLTDRAIDGDKELINHMDSYFQCAAVNYILKNVFKSSVDSLFSLAGAWCSALKAEGGIRKQAAGMCSAGRVESYRRGGSTNCRENKESRSRGTEERGRRPLILTVLHF